MRILIFHILILVVIIPSSLAQSLQDTCCVSKFSGLDIEKAELTELSKEFRRLSSLGNLCCDKWDSDLHQIMNRVGNYFGKEGTEIKLIIKYLGMPDGTEKELQYASISLEENEKALIYFWRGYHDFLYFVYEDDAVKYADWFMWGE